MTVKNEGKYIFTDITFILHFPKNVDRQPDGCYNNSRCCTLII